MDQAAAPLLNALAGCHAADRTGSRRRAAARAAMLAVAGHRGDLLISRDAHKSVVAWLIFAGVRPPRR